MAEREDKVRKMTGWFLEVIFLVFILGYGSVSAVAPTDDDRLAISVASIALVEPVCRVSHDFNPDSSFCLKLPVPELHLSTTFFDISDARLLTGKAFFLSLFERNVFYVFTSINAP